MAKRVISARALKFLFASGILRGKGSGKNRTVTYDKARAATVSRNRKRGVDVTSRKKASQVNKSGRHVFGGSKAARLRSGSAPARRVPSKAERDATRAERITRGNQALERFVGRQASEVRRKNTAGRKEMKAKYGGTFADTGKKFNAGDTIHYGDGGAHARPGTLSLRKRPNFNGPSKDRSGAVRRAAALATNSQLNQRRDAAGQNDYFRRSGLAQRDVSGNRSGRNGRTSSVLVDEFKNNLRRAGLSPRRTRINRKELAATLRARRKSDPKGAREWLWKYGESEKSRYILKNPDRRK